MGFELSKEVQWDGIELQLMSDIHLEFDGSEQSIPPWEPKAPILCLLGDIGYGTKKRIKEFNILMNFLATQAKRYEFVLFVPGNHEYYFGEYEEVMQNFREAFNPIPNLKLMHKTSLLIKGVRILGTTLWTKIPEDQLFVATKILNDYSTIEFGNEQLTPKITNQFHTEDVNWLRSEIEKGKTNNEPVIILTHHAPYLTDEGWLDGTDLHELFNAPVAVWCFGHTHKNVCIEKEGTLLLSNQAGYHFSPDEREGFNTARVLRVNKKGQFSVIN